VKFRTDNGHELQARFHWHVEGQGIRHAYIRPASPQFNGKVERSHGTDEQEFYQLPSYTGDVDLNAKLGEWERLYNVARLMRPSKGRRLTKSFVKSYNHHKDASHSPSK